MEGISRTRKKEVSIVFEEKKNSRMSWFVCLGDVFEKFRNMCLKMYELNRNGLLKGLVLTYDKMYDKNKESSYLQYWDISNLYDWTMSQKLPLNNFDWINDTSQFNKDFIKTITNKVGKDIFLKLVLNILKNYMNFIII